MKTKSPATGYSAGLQAGIEKGFKRACLLFLVPGKKWTTAEKRLHTTIGNVVYGKKRNPKK